MKQHLPTIQEIFQHLFRYLGRSVSFHKLSVILHLSLEHGAVQIASGVDRLRVSAHAIEEQGQFGLRGLEVGQGGEFWFLLFQLALQIAHQGVFDGLHPLRKCDQIIQIHPISGEHALACPGPIAFFVPALFAVAIALVAVGPSNIVLLHSVLFAPFGKSL